MTVYAAFLIPFVISAFLYFIFRHKITLWEIAIPIVVTILFVLFAKWLSINSLTSDTEYLGGYVEDARYYEDWNEEVSCRHPIYCEECSGEGKDRSCHDVVCGYEHSYDVDYHSEYWMVSTTLGTFIIPERRYDELVRKFEMEPVFKELNRDYHNNDGDLYYVTWNDTDDKLEPVAVEHTYENRPQVSSGVYRYQEIDSFDIATYKPFDYPLIHNTYHQQVILGYADPIAEQMLQVVNSRLGRDKQVRVYFLVFNDQPREAGQIQQRYWQNGNKNELIVCIGLDREKKIKWSHVFSWTEQEEVKINIKNHIESNAEFKLREYVDVVHKEINDHWIRKEFHDFDYLQIYPTSTQTLWIFILTILINGGIAVWIVLNEFEDDDSNYDQNKHFSKFLKKIRKFK
ncbi:MAG: tripartite tricarboxylate transporter TctB family protein [Richelia sp. RM2_1_2]|nr:tripartite tricarboxylate transporter TctB family protein [Richelia sp. RM2_1_2]